MIIKVYICVVMLLMLLDLTIALLNKDDEGFSKTAVYMLVFTPLVCKALGWI